MKSFSASLKRGGAPPEASGGLFPSPVLNTADICYESSEGKSPANLNKVVNCWVAVFPISALLGYFHTPSLPLIPLLLKSVSLLLTSYPLHLMGPR